MTKKRFLMLVFLTAIFLSLTINFSPESAQAGSTPYCSFIDPKEDLIYIYTCEPAPSEYYFGYLDIVQSQSQLGEITLNFEIKVNSEIPTPELTTFWTILIDRNNNPEDNCPDYPTENVDTMYSVIYDSTTKQWKMERAVYESWGWDTKPTEATWQREADAIYIIIPTYEIAEVLPEAIPWKVKTETFNGPSIGDIAPNKGLYSWPPPALDEHMVNAWPQFRRNWAHTGFINLENPPPLNNKTTFARAVPFANENNTLASSPIVADGTVFVATTNGTLFAYDALTGTTKWTFKIEEGIFSTPAVSSGCVYLAGYDNKTYVIDGETGTQVTSLTLDDIIVSSITYRCGKMFLLASLYGNIYAYSQGLKELKWSLYIDGGLASTPAFGAGVVFIGSLDNKTYAIDASDGSIIWVYKTEGPIYSSPAYYDGVVYIGSFDGYIYALDAYSGNLKWRYKTGGPVVSSPAIGSKQDLNWTDDLLFIGSGDNKIYSLFAENGRLNWAYSTEDKISFSSPALASYWETPQTKRTILYIGSMDRHVYALDAVTGDLVWKYETGREVVSSPAIAYDRVYICSLDGCLYVFGPPDPISDNVDSGNQTEGFKIITLTLLLLLLPPTLLLLLKRKSRRRFLIANLILLILLAETVTLAPFVPKVRGDLRNVQYVTKVNFYKGIGANVTKQIGSRKSVSLSWEGAAEAGLNMSSTFSSTFNAYWGRIDPNSWEKDWPNRTTTIETTLKSETPYLFAKIAFKSDFKVKKHKVFGAKWEKEWKYNLKGLIGTYEYLLKKGRLTELEFSIWIIGIKVKLYYKLYIKTEGEVSGNLETNGPYIPQNITANPPTLTWQKAEQQTQEAQLGPVNGSVPLSGFDGDVYFNTNGINITAIKLSLELWVSVKICFVIIKAKVGKFKLCTIPLDFLKLLGIKSIDVPATPNRFSIAEYPFLATDPPTPVTNKIPEDINRDGKVNIVDVAIVARAFGTYPGHPRWNPKADLDGNNVINIIDLAKVARKFGYP